jgi:hypothetical protein
MKSVEGLAKAHAYTVLGVITLTTKSNGLFENDSNTDGKLVQKLIKMRNPWGTEKYTGPWHDYDSRWTPEFNKQAGHVKGDDGTFFMTTTVFR